MYRVSMTILFCNYQSYLENTVIHDKHSTMNDLIADNLSNDIINTTKTTI